VRLQKKIVRGQEYYYLVESIRLNKTKTFSLYLGGRIPDKRQLEGKKQELLDRIYTELLGTGNVYLTKEQLIEAEKRKRRYAERIKQLGKTGREDKEEIDAVNFIYTTLTTEGVPITKEDAGLAYRFDQKNVKSLRDDNLRIALDMINGLRYVKESEKGISLEFILKLHGMIMAESNEKHPGEFRKTQAYIYLKNYEKAEEIRFRPPPSEGIREKVIELVAWYNSNLGKLNPLELAALLHLRFYRIHPFEDGNKRVSRLLLNKALFDSSYPMLNISKETTEYFDALIASVEKSDEKPFVLFVYSRFVEDI